MKKIIIYSLILLSTFIFIPSLKAEEFKYTSAKPSFVLYYNDRYWGYNTLNTVTDNWLYEIPASNYVQFSGIGGFALEVQGSFKSGSVYSFVYSWECQNCISEYQDSYNKGLYEILDDTNSTNKIGYKSFSYTFEYINDSTTNGLFKFNFVVEVKADTNVITFKTIPPNYTNINYPEDSYKIAYNASKNVFKYRSIGFQVTTSTDKSEIEQQKTNQKLDELNKNQNETNNKLNDLNNNITNDNVDDAINSGNDFFDSFKDEDYGFSDIVKMPLTFINNITSTTCTPLTFPLPFVDTNVELPCMMPIYKKHFGNILTVYQTITFGMVAYWVCINLFKMVKNFKNPDNDEVEVLDL